MACTRAILCLDIDGTLIDAQEKIHPQDREALQGLPDWLQVIITTGRILHSAKGVLQANSVFMQVRFPLPGVFMNGGSAFLPNERLYRETNFDSPMRMALISLTHEFPKTAFTFFTGTQVHLVNPTPFGQHISTLHYLAAQPTMAESLPERIIKVMVLDDDPAILNRIKEETQSWAAEMAFSLPYAYEINPLGVTKAPTVKLLLQKLALSHLPIYVAGDAQNDLSLFEMADFSFAPTTAHPDVLSGASQIIARDREGLLTPIIREIRNNAEQIGQDNRN